MFNNFEPPPSPSSPLDRPSSWLSGVNGPRNDANTNARRRGGGGSSQLLPGPGYCGLTSLAHRIYGGDDTQLDDYPWMALLEYQSRKCSHIIFICLLRMANPFELDKKSKIK